MGKYELTKAQWEAIMGTTPWSGKLYVLNDPNSPAVYVLWNDAQAFMTALNTHLTNIGQGAYTARLPSEAEWEYACRAGTAMRFYWGDDPSYTQIGDYAWYVDNAWSVNEGYAHIFGQKLPNAWGLYDMSGNVWEWCQDWYHSSYTEAPKDGSAWESPGGSSRVIRGGCWFFYAHFCRCAFRGGYPPSYTHSDVGFRVCLQAGGS
jgi:formylglycine-generating enzyme required for sulfatase activity